MPPETTHPPIWRCPPTPLERTVGTYRLEWPLPEIPADLVLDATTALLDRLDGLGYLPAGQVDVRVTATVPVRLGDDGPDDARPWESRDGYAADLLDYRAA